MTLDVPSFVHDYQPGAIHYGRGCVADLGEALADRDRERALLVCGRNVGANDALLDPIRAGLGERLAGEFTDTTPAKRVETAFDVVDAMRAADADALVPVGGGSSLDVATVASVLHGGNRDLTAVREEVAATGDIAVPPGDPLVPLFPVPTTFAGADLSVMAGISVPTAGGGRTSAGVSDPALMPAALFYDPDAVETTPPDVLAGSAFNGFDKALETVYSPHATPVTDATALRALRYLGESLPRLRTTGVPTAMERAVTGVVLAQYGVAVPESFTLGVVHAFGHALRDEFDIQQGVAHAIVVPHVLEALFDRVDGRRAALAEALVDGDHEDPAAAVVARLREIRDALDLPGSLSAVADPTDEAIRRAAAETVADDLFDLAPEGFDPAVADVERVLRAAR